MNKAFKFVDSTHEEVVRSAKETNTAFFDFLLSHVVKKEMLNPPVFTKLLGDKPDPTVKDQLLYAKGYNDGIHRILSLMTD